MSLPDHTTLSLRAIRPLPVPPVRHQGSAARVDLLPPSGLPAAERARWARLSARAAPGNIFAQDWFMEPALRHCGTALSLRLAVVRQCSGEWLGVLPLALYAGPGRWPLPSLNAWHAPGQCLGTPLVLPGAERAFWEALLARLDHRPGLALALLCEDLPLDDPATRALASLCREQERIIATLNRTTRPARLPSGRGTPEAATLRRFEQRLDGLEEQVARELGPVSLVLHRADEDAEAWIAAFLALERGASRGRRGTAPACAPAGAGLFREAIRHGQRAGAARLASLRAGDHILAMACWFVAGGHGFVFKAVDDAAWRHCEPGRLLMRRALRLAGSEVPPLFDSCAPAGSPPDPLWPDEHRLASFAVAIGGPTRRAVLRRMLDAPAVRQAAGGAQGRLAETA